MGKALCVACFLLFLQPILVFGQSDSQSRPEVTATYDKFQDKTTTMLKTVLVSGTPTEGIYMGAGFVCKGSNTCKPLAVIFQLLTITKRLSFSDSPNLIILTDGKRLNCGQLKSSGKEETADGFYTEAFGIAFSVDNFKRLANSTKIEMQFGSEEFELTPIQIEGLKEIANRIK